MTDGKANRPVLRYHGGKWRPTISRAICDDCGKEDDTTHQGRVTAPLPHGWTYREEPTKSGKSVRMMYGCGCKS